MDFELLMDYLWSIQSRGWTLFSPIYRISNFTGKFEEKRSYPLSYGQLLG